MNKFVTEIISVADRADIHQMPKAADSLLKVASIILAQDIGDSGQIAAVDNQVRDIATRQQEALERKRTMIEQTKKLQDAERMKQEAAADAVAQTQNEAQKTQSDIMNMQAEQVSPQV